MLSINYLPATNFPLPNSFPSPFNRSPHPLAELAVKHCNDHILKAIKASGMMIHLLVITDKKKRIGYLLAIENDSLDKGEHVAPPLFDRKAMQTLTNHYEKQQNELTQRLQQHYSVSIYQEAQLKKEQITQSMQTSLSKLRELHKKKREIRHKERKKLANNLLDLSLTIKQRLLNKESCQDKLQRKKTIQEWEKQLAPVQAIIDQYDTSYQHLKNLQEQLKKQFEEDKRQLHHVYQSSSDYQPLSHWATEIREGTANNTTIRLLSYANKQNYQLITITSFWWGKMPTDEVRHHTFYYPAKKSLCSMLIPYLLSRYKREPDPIPAIASIHLKLPILLEDDAIIVVNKPSGLLSVPGKMIKDSVYHRIKTKYPTATGPLLVHRLDMSTSGILLIAKTKEVHKYLQQQFTARQVKKQYIALLDTSQQSITDSGIIDFPLRTDFDDRPRQKICTTYGKPAQTQWNVLQRNQETTRIIFSPITGRTHQLRMHAAHYLGLNAPILGDVLYHRPSQRLMLHATSLRFKHPISRQLITINSTAPF